MKKLLTILLLTIGMMSAAQTITKTDGYYQAKEKKKDVPFGDSYKDKDGKVYPIFQTAKGRFYIIRISKKTGNPYHYYLNIQNETI